MTEEQNYYASPEANLEPETSMTGPEPSAGDDPTTFVDTIVGMFKVYPKVIWGLMGYYLLGVANYVVFRSLVARNHSQRGF